MIKLDKVKLEKKLGKKLETGISVLGVDTASRTGYCTASADKKWLYLDYGFIDSGSSSDLDFKYKRLTEAFNSLVDDKDRIVIEDTFLGFNPVVFRTLSRIGMIVYVVAELKKKEDKYFISAFESRSRLGLKGNAKKVVIQEQFLKILGIKLDDIDIIDAILLAIVGLIIKPEQEKL